MAYTGQNTQGYNNLINLGYNEADATSQANANQPNPNFYPTYGPSNVPSGFTGPYRDLQGNTVNGGQQPTPQVNTGQPSPQTAQIAPPNQQLGIVDTLNQAGQASDFASRTKLAGQYGIQNYTGTADQNTQLANQYRQGLANAKGGGQPPTTQGSASSAIAQVMPGQQQESPSAWPTVFDIDPNIDKGFPEYDDWMSPTTQKETLLEQYTSMTKALGIADLNTEMLNAKNIIEGNEDMIRSEITAAGGFATDGQVMAMTNARNKSLIVNYNKLVDLKTSTMQQLETMMDLSIKDRQMAADEFDRKMNYAFKAKEFQQRATDNARQVYMTLGDKMGWDTMLGSMSSYDKGIMQKVLGVSGDALNNLALRSQEDRTMSLEERGLDLDLKRSSLETDKLQRENIRSQIDERNQTADSYGTIDGKPQNQAQSAAQSYGNRMNESGVILDTLGSQFTGKNAFGGKLPNILQTGKRQSYEQAKRNFLTAVLRRESGASIAPTEFDTGNKLYFPVAGDTPDTVAQKEKTRNGVINNFYREANVNRPVLPGMVIQSGGKKYKVGMDGETLTEI